MTRLQMKIVAGLSVTACVGVLIWGTGNASGFCWSEARFQSDDELVQNAVASSYLDYGYLNKNDVANRTGVGKNEILKLVPYDNVRQFLNLNPDCCMLYRSRDETYQSRIDSGGVHHPRFHHRFFDIAWSKIAVRRKVFFVTTAGEDKLILDGNESWIDACGIVVETPLKHFVG